MERIYILNLWETHMMIRNHTYKGNMLAHSILLQRTIIYYKMRFKKNVCMGILVKHTLHSEIRAQQRAINQKMIEDTIEYGELIRKQGMRFFIATEKSLCYIHDHQYYDHLKNTVVVLNSDNTIRTVYKNAKAIKAIKRKSKELFKRH